MCNEFLPCEFNKNRTYRTRMDWIFESREKSLASNAQRIVADMHKHLDREKQRNKELENMVLRFQNLCTESLEHELRRLELRKIDLISELETIDRQIIEKRTVLDRTREEVRSVLANAGRDSADAEDDKYRHDHKVLDVNRLVNSHENHSGYLPVQHSEPVYGSSVGRKDSSMNQLENQYQEEEELLETCREIVHNFLFLVHQSDSRDLVSYNLSLNPKSLDIIEVCKVVNISRLPSTIPLLPNDKICFDSKIIPNHDRDFPDIRDIEYPFYLLSESQQQSRTLVILGHLLGAFEIPIVPEVLIDVWKVDLSAESNSFSKTIWATTTVDNVNFAVLERIFITYDVSFGDRTIMQVDLFGRHPRSGAILVESIVPT